MHSTTPVVSWDDLKANINDALIISGVLSSYNYGEGLPIDLSEDYQTNSDYSSSRGSKSVEAKAGPNWELCFARFLYLDDIKQTLEFILTDDDCYDAADLFICTSIYHSSADNDHNDDDNNNNQNYRSNPEVRSISNGSNDEEQQDKIQNLLNKLRLLKGYKQYQIDNQDITEDLIFAIEDEFNIPLQSMLRLESKNDIINAHDDIIYIINQQKDKIDEIYDLFAFEVVPSFVRSSDFASFFETHAVVKARNKKLRIDSKSWVGKFQKAVVNHHIPFHLFAFGGGRPYGNKQMRNLFGPMVDSPSPKEYIDSQTETRVIDTVLNAMKTGADINIQVYLRTIKKGSIDGVLFIKHFYSFKFPEQIKFSLIEILDLNDPQMEIKRKIIETIFTLLP